MSPVALYWVVIGSIALVLFLFSLREILLLLTVPKGHPDRGFYWFNSVFLLLCIAAVLYGGSYIDLGRRTFEELMKPYPTARYAYERNGVIHDTMWVYVTHDDPEAVREFYRKEAARANISFIEDNANPELLSFTLPSGPMFLTIKKEDGEVVLYFSRNGEIKRVNK